MGPDGQLVLIFGLLHFAMIAMVGVLLVLFMRSETRPEWRPSGEDDGSDGGGGSERRPPDPRGPAPIRALPLPETQPSTQRLRGGGRLADAYPPRIRRGRPEPARTPVRRRSPARR